MINIIYTSLLKMTKDFLLSQLAFICDKLNKSDINYYLVGALSGYIDCNLEITREHDDIDIMILEKDINKLYDILKDSDYTLVDNRNQSNKFLNDKGFTEGEYHDVYAIYKDTNFHIGFFLYSLTDKDYSIIEYFRQEGSQKRLIRTLPIQYFNCQYDNKFKIYKGIKLRTAKVECIYNNKKNMTRDKDKYDNLIFEKYIDKTIISKMAGKSKYRIAKIENL